MSLLEATLIHIPHSSTTVPEKFISSFLLSKEELNQELLKMTDHFVDDIFMFSDIVVHKNRSSRLVMDPERFSDDKVEPMAQKGMGFAYTKTSDGRPLRIPTQHEKLSILNDLYNPYHQDLTDKVKLLLSKQGVCLIIDAHSFPSKPLPYEIIDGKRQLQRPDVCLCYDPYHMNKDLLRKAEWYFMKQCGLSVAHNEPFSGSMVPYQFYRREPRVISLMIEINRSLYMNEQTGERNNQYSQVKKWITGFYSCVLNNAQISSP